MAMKWWGWGEEQRSFALSDPERFWSFLQTRRGEISAHSRLRSLDQIVLARSRFKPEALAALKKILDPQGITNPGKLAPDNGEPTDV